MKGPLDRFVSRSRSAGLPVPEEARVRLSRFVDLSLKLGDRLSLLSRADLQPGRIIGRHFADALGGLLFAAPADGARVLDYGAGAGLVGITWAILRPDLSVTLLESRRKKSAFLRRAAVELSLGNVTVWEGRGEDPGERAAAFDLVASRGVATNTESLSAIALLLVPGGAALFFKGPETSAEADRLIREDGRFSPPLESVLLLGGEKRRVYLLTKV